MKGRVTQASRARLSLGTPVCFLFLRGAALEDTYFLLPLRTLPPPSSDALEGGGTPPRPGRPAYAQPLSPLQQVPASVAFVTDSNRPQPL